MSLQKIAAFCDGPAGGTPAGVWISGARASAVAPTMWSWLHMRNAFASRGLLEELATGAAIDVVQGEDMDACSRLHPRVGYGTVDAGR